MKEGTRADISTVGLWQHLERAFIDIQIFNPNAKKPLKWGRSVKCILTMKTTRKGIITRGSSRWRKEHSVQQFSAVIEALQNKQSSF